MTDRELLEAAAKAAHIDVEWYSGLGMGACVGGPFPLWRPLEDDGDALRLAVKLDIRFSPTANSGEHCCAGLTFEPGGVFVEERGSDPYAATRRAIVRAAAAISLTAAGRYEQRATE